MARLSWFVLLLRFNYTVSSAGLIDYNFHCFRKAIQEVFEVGNSVQRSGFLDASPPISSLASLKAGTLNGTPRNVV